MVIDHVHSEVNVVALGCSVDPPASLHSALTYQADREDVFAVILSAFGCIGTGIAAAQSIILAAQAKTIWVNVMDQLQLYNPLTTSLLLVRLHTQNSNYTLSTYLLEIHNYTLTICLEKLLHHSLQSILHV